MLSSYFAAAGEAGVSAGLSVVVAAGVAAGTGVLVFFGFGAFAAGVLPLPV